MKNKEYNTLLTKAKGTNINFHMYDFYLRRIIKELQEKIKK
jgi:hypothetical protein